jgi:hypothetical protein
MTAWLLSGFRVGKQDDGYIAQADKLLDPFIILPRSYRKSTNIPTQQRVTVIGGTKTPCPKAIIAVGHRAALRSPES